MGRSTLFILFLIIILTFILGFRYGQHVEKNNKVIDYILSITPYSTYTPYPTPTKTASSSSILKPTRVISPSSTVIPNQVNQANP